MRKPKKSAKLWIARNRNGTLYLFRNKPIKQSIFWCSKAAGTMKINSELFPDVKWEDEEPTQVTLRI